MKSPLLDIVKRLTNLKKLLDIKIKEGQMKKPKKKTKKKPTKKSSKKGK